MERLAKMMLSYKSGKKDWDNLVSELSGAHILQSWDWGEFKAENEWKVSRFIWENQREGIFATAQILERQQKLLPLMPNLKILYVPKGPLLKDWNNDHFFREVISDLVAYARKRKAIFIKIDPDILIEGEDLIEFPVDALDCGKQIIQKLQHNGWFYSNEQIQFKNTVWINLRADENTLINGMKSKTRYNLKISQKKGVKIHRAQIEDLPLLYDLYAQTSTRDGFIIRPEKYYISLWERMFKSKKAIGLIAFVEGKPVAGLILFIFAQKAWYFYGMSSDYHREKMPNYLLQWEAIRIAKQMGCSVYDLWGAPDVLDETDPMWGVVRFKLGLGGKLVRTIGAWDFPVNKFVYNIYLSVLPRILSFTRIWRKRQIQKETLKTMP